MAITKTVGEYVFGSGSFEQLADLLRPRREIEDAPVVFLLDHFFAGGGLMRRLPAEDGDLILMVDTTDEPTTDSVDGFTSRVWEACDREPAAIVAIGGGSTLDTGKAVSNLLTNPGQAADYQGWDLLGHRGVFKIGVPTISGTGAEASRTCVMLNAEKNIKLGMISEFSIFDQLLLDPDLTSTVPREQFFHTAMDTYIHCVESLGGRFRHPVADSFSKEALRLCRESLLEDDMQSPGSREKLMVASYLGGSAIGNSFVGVVHPVSAGLSMVFHTHHCIGNCIALNGLDEFYPEEAAEFRRMRDVQNIPPPPKVCTDVTEDQLVQLYDATIVHAKPLANALGDRFADILNFDKAASIFRQL